MSHLISKNKKTHCCPTCKTPLTAATGVDTDAKPQAADISICYMCGEILTFGAGLIHRKMSEEVLNLMKENDPETYELITQISETVKKRNKI